MIFPATTALYAALFAFLSLGLSGWVMASRIGSGTLIGDGGDQTLTRRIRSHANFTEYVPFALLLIALLEGGGASKVLVQTLLIVLLVGRLLHPVGMLAPANSPQQFACRGGGILATFGVTAVAAVMLLTRAL